MEDAPKLVNTVLKVLGGTILGTLCSGFAGGTFGVVLISVAEATDPAMAGIHTIACMVFVGAASLACLPGALTAAISMIWRPRFSSLLAAVFAVLLTLYLTVEIPSYDASESWAFGFLFYFGSPLVGAMSGWAAIAKMQSLAAPPN